MTSTSFLSPASKALAFVLFVAAVGCAQPAAPRPEPAQSAAPKAEPARTDAASSAPSSPAPQVEKKQVKGVYAAISMLAVPFWIAAEAGLFEKYGLDVSLQYVAAGSTGVAAMISDEVEIGNIAPEATMAANAGGEDIVFIADMIPGLVINLYAGPDITRVADLRGKRIGITRAGTTTDNEAQYIVRREGLPLDSVDRVQMGGIPEVFVGLESGAVDAGLLSFPMAAQAEARGYRAIFEGKTIPYPLAPVLAKRSFVNAYPNTTRAFLKALVEAMRRYRTDPVLAKDVIGKNVKITDPEVLDRTYNYYLTVYPERPVITKEALATSQEWAAAANPEVKNISIERMIDNRPMEALVAEGFFSQPGPR